MMYKTKRKEAVDNLSRNVYLLQELIDNPQHFGAYIVIGKVRHSESKIPLNVSLLDLKIEIDRKIRKLNRKIEQKLGWWDDVPDGLKK